MSSRRGQKDRPPPPPEPDSEPEEAPAAPPARKSQASTIPSLPPLATRPGNKNTHPGMVDKAAPRRPSSVVQAERREKESAKADSLRRRAAVLEATAAFENTVAEETRERQRHASNPPNPGTLPPRRTNPRRNPTRSPHGMEAPGSLPNEGLDEPDQPVDDRSVDDDDDPPFSPSQGDGEDSTDDDEEMEVEEEEQVEVVGSAKSNKGRGRKGARKGREEIMKKRQQMMSMDSVGTNEFPKRRRANTPDSIPDAPTTRPVPKKSKSGGGRSQELGGLVDGWDQHYGAPVSDRSSSPATQPPLTDNDPLSDFGDDGGRYDTTFADEDDGTQAGSNLWNNGEEAHRTSVKLTWAKTNVVRGRHTLSATESSRATSLARETPSLGDGDESELPALVEYVPEVVRTKIIRAAQQTSLDKTNGKRHSTGRHTAPNNAADSVRSGSSKKKRVRYKTSDIPVKMQKKWVEEFVPAAKRMAGANKNPWLPLSVEDVQELMDQVFPTYRKQHLVTKDDVFHDVCNQRIREWRSGFGTRGLEAIETWVASHRASAEEDGRGKPTTDELAIQVLKLLNRERGEVYDEDVEYKKTKPFMWQVWSSDARERKGPFQSGLILYTFYWHVDQINEVEGISDDYPGDDGSPNKVAYPVGAMILSILAVERALKSWATGELIEPDRSSQLGWFSGDNWGDHVKYVDGVPTKMKRTSTFLKPLAEFTREDWFNIFKGAIAKNQSFGSKKRRSRRAPAAVTDQDTGPESDADGDMSLYD